MVKNKAALFVSATLNGSWLLNTIDISLWLHKSDKYEEITVNCLENDDNFNLSKL